MNYSNDDYDDGYDGNLSDLWSCQKAWLQLQLPPSEFMATPPIFKQHLALDPRAVEVYVNSECMC